MPIPDESEFWRVNDPDEQALLELIQRGAITLREYTERMNRIRSGREPTEYEYLGRFSTPPTASIENIRRMASGVEETAAHYIWRLNNGRIVCECDNPDCFEVIVIGEQDYITACGPGGHFRVTSPRCSYGVLNSRLILRTAIAHSWCVVP